MSGIYIHIPYCRTRCSYCDFFTSAGHTARHADYVSALCEEMRARSDFFGRHAVVDTIYIGGGTPSLLAPELIHDIIECARSTFALSPTAEITIEANPDDMTTDYVRAISRTAVNRVSMGVQTFSDEGLRSIDRRHSSAQAVEAVHRAVEYGLDNVSIDLIYGLPGQDEARWAADLHTAFSLPVRCISAYAGIYEEGTKITRMRERGEVREADDEQSLRFFEMLIDEAASHGFEHYEISNFALPGHRSRHNSSYWQGVPYLGLGPGAHSFDGRSTRFYNAPLLEAYVKGRGISGIRAEHLTEEERYNDFVLTRLRTSDGLPLAELAEKFGLHLHNYMMRMAAPHLSSGTLTLAEDTLRLTRRGIFVSDAVMSDLMWVD